MRLVAVTAAAVLLAGCTADSSADSDPVPVSRPGPAATGSAVPPSSSGDRPRWDPRDVDDLPPARNDVAPLLPATIEVPDSAPALAESPVEAAVLAVREDDGLYLLAVDGSWRRVPPPSAGDGAELTRDGTRLAVERDATAIVWDLPTGERTEIRAPRGHVPWDYTSWRWTDTDTLLLDDLEGGWLVSTISGSADEVPYPGRTAFYWTVDPRGAVVESADWTHPNVLTDWAGGVRRRIDMSPTGRLASIQVGGDTVVGTSYDNGPFAVYAADRADLTPRHVLRVRDHEAAYSNGGLTVLALLADGTVLLRVAVLGTGPGTPLRVVAWDPASGDLSLVSRVAGSDGLLSSADGLLG